MQGLDYEGFLAAVLDTRTFFKLRENGELPSADPDGSRAPSLESTPIQPPRNAPTRPGLEVSLYMAHPLCRQYRRPYVVP